MRNLNNLGTSVQQDCVKTDQTSIDWDQLSDGDFSMEVIAMFINGDLLPYQRESVLKVLMKNEKIRRKISDYVKFKRFEKDDEDVDKEEIPAALTNKAFDLFNKVKNKKDCIEQKEYQPVYINYAQNEYEINGIIYHKESISLNLELHVTKNGQPYKGEIYLYKEEMLYKTLVLDKETISCDLSNKGSYHLYIKDGEIRDFVDLVFEVK